MGGLYMLKEQLTPRDRVLIALQHMETDRIPMSLGFGINKPAHYKLQEYLGLKNKRDLDDFLLKYSDIRNIEPDYIGPTDRNLVLADGTLVDEWGVYRKMVSYGDGEYAEICHHPFAEINEISELEQYQWPSADWFDTSNIKEKIKEINKEKEYAFKIGIGLIFEHAWYMRGFERMFMDMADHSELAFEILRRVTDYYIALFTKIAQAAEGKLDLVFTGDDIAGQQGLLMSPNIFQEMIKPHHKRLNKAIHEYGAKILYHSCGAVSKIVPDYIDMGVDILEALQFDAAGMDPKELKENYGNKLCFHGGISVQTTLPFGTVDDVREEVKERINILGKDGGYIIAPSHAIQAGTPPENIMAFLETAHQHKR